jgi:hypothetical protein
LAPVFGTKRGPEREAYGQDIAAYDEQHDPIVDDPALTPSATAAAGNWSFYIPNKHASPQIAIALIHFAPQAEVTSLFNGFE